MPDECPELGIPEEEPLLGADTRRSGRWRTQLLRQGGSAFFIRALGLLLSFFVNIFIARAVGISSYGIYTFVVTVAAFVAVLGRLGLDTAVVRFVPEYRLAGDLRSMRGLIQSSLFLVWTVSFLGACIAIVVLTMIPPKGIDSTRLIALVLLAPALALLALGQGVLRGFGRITEALIPDYLVRPLLMALVVAGILMFQEGPLTPTMLLFAVGLAWALAASINWIAVLIVARGVFRRSIPSRFAFKEWLGVSLALFGMGTLNMMLARADLLIVGAFRTPSDVGFYAAAVRIATLISFVLTSLNVIAAPLIVEMHAQSREHDLKRLVTMVVRVGSAGGVACLLLLLFFGHALLAAFGSGFQAGWLPLLVLAGGQILNLSVGPAGYLLAMTGSHKEAFWILLQGATLNVIVAITAVRAWGVVGAALAATLALIWWKCAMTLHVRRRFGWWIIPFFGVRDDAVHG